MNITEIRIKLRRRTSRDKLRGFASITLDDCLVIRDLKIIEGAQGLFVAMPSRKLYDRCPACAGKNHLRARYCNDCGARLREERGEPTSAAARASTPTSRTRSTRTAATSVQRRVLAAFHEELERSQAGGLRRRTHFDDLDYHMV